MTEMLFGLALLLFGAGLVGWLLAIETESCRRADRQYWLERCSDAHKVNQRLRASLDRTTACRDVLLCELEALLVRHRGPEASDATV